MLLSMFFSGLCKSNKAHALVGGYQSEMKRSSPLDLPNALQVNAIRACVEPNNRSQSHLRSPKSDIQTQWAADPKTLLRFCWQLIAGQLLAPTAVG